MNEIKLETQDGTKVVRFNGTPFFLKNGQLAAVREIFNDTGEESVLDFNTYAILPELTEHGKKLQGMLL